MDGDKERSWVQVGGAIFALTKIRSVPDRRSIHFVWFTWNWSVLDQVFQTSETIESSNLSS